MLVLCWCYLEAVSKAALFLCLCRLLRIFYMILWCLIDAIFSSMFCVIFQLIDTLKSISQRIWQILALPAVADLRCYIQCWETLWCEISLCVWRNVKTTSNFSPTIGCGKRFYIYLSNDIWLIFNWFYIRLDSKFSTLIYYT